MVWGAVVGMATSQLLGMVLYSKLVLGPAWMRATFRGKTTEQINEMQRQGFPVAFTMCLLSQALLVVILHYIVGPYLQVTSLELAVKVAMTLAGIAMLVDVPHCVFGQRAAAGFVIDHLYNAIVLVTMAACFVYFG